MTRFFSSLKSRGAAAALALALGVVAGFAFQPFGLPALLWFCFPAFYLLVQRTKTVREAFAVGWAFAFGLLVLCLHWIAGALFVDIGAFWWALPFAVLGLPTLFALYYGAAAALARRRGLEGPAGVATLAAAFFLAEMARAHLFTGFPWDMVGYVWADTLPVLQLTHWIGVEGLTFVTLVLAFLPALFFTNLPRHTALVTMAIGVVVFSGAFLFGQERLLAAPQENEPVVRLRLVQPNLDQALKWRPERRIENYQNLLRLTFESPWEKPPTHFIWPETATSYYLAEEPALRSRLAEALPRGAVLMTGAVRRDGEGRFYNSLIAMDDLGTVVAAYDKHHLVPFGEYMPLGQWLPLRAIASMGTDFSAGEGPRTLRAPALPPFSPLVCYEAIFSSEVVEKDDPPRLLLNVTNDAWYRGTIGPAKHFMIARVRAVEEGLPLVRVANGGVTGIVDPYGRITGAIGANQAGVIDLDLPKPVKAQGGDIGFAQKTTLFSVIILLFLLDIPNLVRRIRA